MIQKARTKLASRIMQGYKPTSYPKCLRIALPLSP